MDYDKIFLEIVICKVLSTLCSTHKYNHYYFMKVNASPMKEHKNSVDIPTPRATGELEDGI